MHSASTAGPSGSSATAVDGRPGEHQVGARGLGGLEAREAAHHARCGPSAGPSATPARPAGAAVGRAAHPQDVGAAVARAPASRRRGGTRTPSRRAGPPRCPPRTRIASTTSSGQLLVLGREGSIAGRTIATRSRGAPAARRRAARRPSRPPARTYGRRKIPGPATRGRPVVLVADVAAPHHDGAAAAQAGRQPGRLRVVQHHDVAAPDQRRQLVGVVAQHALVRRRVLGRAERPAVALVAVQVVVEPLRDGEERRGARR